MNRCEDLTPESIASVYLGMLGRAPESDSVIDYHMKETRTTVNLVRGLAQSAEFMARVGPRSVHSSPYFHPNASVNCRAIIESHINHNRAARPGCYVNFLGVAIPVKVMSQIKDKAGQLDQVPIPKNFHADMAEWAAALRAVDLSRNTFTMIELGCGWGCWMNNTGLAARARGLKVHLIGIEGDDTHLDYARETLGINGFQSSDYTLLRGIAAGKPGTALFPRHLTEGWGTEPMFGASEEEAREAVASGKYDRLPMVPLDEAIGDRPQVDLVHIDIQGGEVALVEESLHLLSKKAGYLVIGTHSRSIEGRLMDTLIDAGWVLEIERPAIFRIEDGKPVTINDGLQGWKNPTIHRR